MRVLGLARLLRRPSAAGSARLNCGRRRAALGLHGRVELVDCELDGPKLTRLLARLGLRCRVVSARAAKVSVSLPSRGAAAPDQGGRGGPRRFLGTRRRRARSRAAEARRRGSGVNWRCAWPRLLIWRCGTRRRVSTQGMARRAGLVLGSAAISATSPGEETWRKRVVLSGLYAYCDEDAAEWDAQRRVRTAAALVADAANALSVEENVVLEPASLTGSVALTRSSSGLRLDIEGETSHVWRASASAKRIMETVARIILRQKSSSSQSLDSVGTPCPSTARTCTTIEQLKRDINALKNYDRRLPAGGALRLQVRDRSDRLFCHVGGALDLRGNVRWTRLVSETIPLEQLWTMFMFGGLTMYICDEAVAPLGKEAARPVSL